MTMEHAGSYQVNPFAIPRQIGADWLELGRR